MTFIYSHVSGWKCARCEALHRDWTWHGKSPPQFDIRNWKLNPVTHREQKSAQTLARSGANKSTGTAAPQFHHISSTDAFLPSRLCGLVRLQSLA